VLSKNAMEKNMLKKQLFFVKKDKKNVVRFFAQTAVQRVEIVNGVA